MVRRVDLYRKGLGMPGRQRDALLSRQPARRHHELRSCFY